MRMLLNTALAAAFVGAPASATVVYSNNFDAENGGNSALNYNSFNGLTVSDGTVDLIKSGSFGITCPTVPGSCVDLDGSTSNAGLTSSGSYAFSAGRRVALSLNFTGNQRNGPNDDLTILFNFSGLVSGTYGTMSSVLGNQNFGAFTNDNEIGATIFGVPSNFALTDFTVFFDPTNAGTLTFSLQNSGNDNIGIVIDDLSLDIAAVPEPATWAMMVAGFGAVGAGLRRKARMQAVHA